VNYKAALFVTSLTERASERQQRFLQALARRLNVATQQSVAKGAGG